MSDFFGGLRSGIRMPEVVWNQGPLPSGNGLPAPLHQTADARINYNSSLLGDLTPYAYGEPGYLSSQSAYLNIPHKIQKIVPVVWVPEARAPAKDTVDVPHPVDDGDIAFVLRLNRNSVFCTGTKSGSMMRAGLGTAVDPLVNLPTVNYLLSGLQLGLTADPEHSLWHELFQNLDASQFPGTRGRDLTTNPISFDDVRLFVQTCIRPFGVARGSEKQGGQDEATLSPATWPVSFVTSLTIDGKESNVVNIWHHLDLSAGDDLVLRLKLLPVLPYTLNHYYKGVKRLSWAPEAFRNPDGRPRYVWQLAPDLMHLDPDGITSERERQEHAAAMASLPAELQTDQSWQEVGYWHIGRTQIMSGQYGREDYWHNDMANMLKTNHLDMTFQPMYRRLPALKVGRAPGMAVRARLAAAPPPRPGWSAMLGLERLSAPAPREPRPLLDRPPVPTFQAPAAMPAAEPVKLDSLPEPAKHAEHAEPVEPPELGEMDRLPNFEDEPMQASEAGELEVPVPGLEGAGKRTGDKRGGKRRALSGSLLKVDGSAQPSHVGLL